MATVVETILARLKTVVEGSASSPTVDRVYRNPNEVGSATRHVCFGQRVQNGVPSDGNGVCKRLTVDQTLKLQVPRSATNATTETDIENFGGEVIAEIESDAILASLCHLHYVAQFRTEASIDELDYQIGHMIVRFDLGVRYGDPETRT